MAFADIVAAADRAVKGSLGGITVTYAPAVGDAADVVGVFDANYRLSEQGDAGVEQVVPAVWLTLSDLPSDPNADDPQITIAGDVYAVRERQTDSMGTVLLLLHRADI